MWLLLSFLSAFTQAVYLAIAKKFVKNLSPYVLGSGFFFAAVHFLLGYAAIYGWPQLRAEFYLGAFCAAVLNIAAMIFLYKGLDCTDLSVGSAALALTPILALLASFFILGEVPSILGGVGVIVAVIGFTIVAHEHKNKDCSIEEELKNKKQRRCLVFLLAAAALYSVSVNFDKIASVNSTPSFAAFFVLTAIGFGALLIVIGRKETLNLKRKNNFAGLTVLGLVNLVAVLVWYAALSQGLVVYSVAIKRLSVFLGVGFGYFWFKEKNIKRKFAGAVVVLIGLALIIIFK